MKQMKLLALAFVILFVSLSAWAASMEGKSELRLDGSLQNVSTDNGDVQTIAAQIVYNKFLSDQFSLGVAFRPTIQEESPDEGDSTTIQNIFFLGRGDFYLATGDSQFVPYGGAHAGVINYTYENGGSDESSSVLTYGVQGGGKFFVDEKTSLNF
ncbi:MAG TPA: hypothetical protein PK388_03745, partial [Kiritimatiellia bacterium]|nr:hypothetical protein [Kiritimatiellia bacterium]